MIGIIFCKLIIVYSPKIAKPHALSLYIGLARVKSVLIEGNYQSIINTILSDSNQIYWKIIQYLDEISSLIDSFS